MGKQKKPQKPLHYEIESHPTKVDTLLESADLLVTTAEHVGSVVDVPGLGIAAGIVATILTIVQEVRDNKSAFEQLAYEAYKQVQTLTDTFNHLKSEEGKYGMKRIRKRIRILSKDLEELTETLQKVKDFADIKRHRNLGQRVLYWRYDVQTIRQYRDELAKANEIFQQRSQTVLRFDMAKVDEKTDRILEHLERQEERHEASAAAAAASPTPPSSPPPQPTPPPTNQHYHSPSHQSGYSPFDNPNFPFPPYSPANLPGINITPTGSGNVHVNNTINSGNTSNSTHNGHVYNLGSAPQNFYGKHSNPYLTPQQPAVSTWNHQSY